MAAAEQDDADSIYEEALVEMPISAVTMPSKRQRAIQELVQTEALYAGDLTALTTVYIPLARGLTPHDLTSLLDFSKRVLDEEDIFTIFLNIQQLSDLAASFVALLDHAAGSDYGLHEDDTLGAAFLEMVSPVAPSETHS
jgi:hypothetical protein